MKKSWKSWKNHENHENHEKIKNLRTNFEKIWKIMKNQKFSKSPKFFAFYLESSKNVLPLRNPLGSARPTQHCPGSLPAFLRFFCTFSQDLLDMLLNFKILLICSNAQKRSPPAGANETIILLFFAFQKISEFSSQNLRSPNKGGT